MTDGAWDDNPGEPDLDQAEAREARRLRIAVVSFGLVLLVTMVTSIHLSTLELSFGTLVYGSPRVWRGHETTLRIVAVDPSFGMRSVPIRGGDITLSDREGARGKQNLVGPLAEVRFPIPRDLTDGASFSIRVETDWGEDSFTQSLRAMDIPSASTGRLVSHRELLSKRGRPKQGGSNELRLYPQSGVFVDGLENSVLGWVLDGGEPLATEISSDDVGFRVESSPDGIFEFRWLPRPNPLGYRFSIGSSSARQLLIENEQRQLVVETSPSGFVRPGEELDVTVRTLPVREPLHIDLWLGNALTFGTRMRAGNGRLDTSIRVPAGFEGLARLDVYRSVFAPEHSRSSVNLWVSSKPVEEAVVDAITALDALEGTDPALDAALSTRGEARRTFGTMSLSRFQPDRVGVSLLRSTVEERNTATRQRRDRLRRAVNRMFVIVFVLGVGLAVGFGLRHQLRVHRNVNRVVEEGVSEGEEPQTLRLTRLRDTYNIAIVLAALAFAAYSTLVLLETIRWD